jgi:antitoxin VapB
VSLNIKNPEAFRLAKELAAATGQSMTAAVTEAIRAQLDRIRAEQDEDHGSRVERMLAMAAEIGSRMPPAYLDQDFDELLYDEDGLPR